MRDGTKANRSLHPTPLVHLDAQNSIIKNRDQNAGRDVKVFPGYLDFPLKPAPAASR